MAIVIDLEIEAGKQDGQFRRLHASLDRLERQFDSINGKLLTMAANMRAVASASQGVNAGRGGTVRSGSNGTVARHTKPQAPPFDHQAILGDPHLRSLVMQGDPWAAKVYNRATAQKRSIARAQNQVSPPGFGDNLMSLLMRSRYGGGGGAGGVMPLGMDVAKMFGGAQSGAAGGPIAAGLAAAALSLKVWTELIKVSASSIRALNTTIALGGGTSAQAGAVTRLNAFTGGNATSAVRGRSALQQAMGMSAGVSPFAGHEFFDPLGANAAALKLAQKVGQIADQKGTEAAMVFAHRAGVAEFGTLALLDKQTRQRLIGTQSDGLSGASMKAGAKFDAEVQIFLYELKKLITRFATPALMMLNWAMDKFNSLVGSATRAVMSAVDWFKELWSYLSRMFGSDSPLGGKGGSQKEEWVEAMRENTDAVRELSGTFGGGRRAGVAVPRGISGNASAWTFDDVALRHSLRQGAL